MKEKQPLKDDDASHDGFGDVMSIYLMEEARAGVFSWRSRCLFSGHFSSTEVVSAAGCSSVMAEDGRVGMSRAFLFSPDLRL